MPRYDFECIVCKVAREIDISLENAPKVGGLLVVEIAHQVCSCGSREFIRIMDRKTGGFTMNFRRTGL